MTLDQKRAAWLQSLSNEEYTKLVKVTPVGEDDQSREFKCPVCPYSVMIGVPSHTSWRILPEIYGMAVGAHMAAHDWHKKEAKA